MFEKLKAFFKRLRESSPGVDPSVFEDPIAERTEWTPAKGGGASFTTRRLVQVHPDRPEFRPTLGARAFYLVFLLVGLGVGIGVPVHEGLTGTLTIGSLTFPLVFGLIFATAGGLMYYFGTKPIRFDKSSGYYWRGRKDPSLPLAGAAPKDSVRIEEIHALQILSEYCSGGDSSYYSYELNLVLKDGSRMNVVDHGKYDRLLEDAEVLANFLDVPIWDAS